MTVAELMNRLSECDPDDEVLIPTCCGEDNYGSINMLEQIECTLYQQKQACTCCKPSSWTFDSGSMDTGRVIHSAIVLGE